MIKQRNSICDARSMRDSAGLTGSFGVELSSRVVLSWVEIARPLYSCINHSMAMCHPRKRGWSWARQISVAETIPEEADSC